MKLTFSCCVLSVLLFPALHDAAIQEQKVGSTGSQTCLPLPHLEHGIYVCTESIEYTTCELKCMPNYIIPITQVGPSITRLSLQERGLYKCVDMVGGKVWSPALTFDCVEAKYPTDVTFYYDVIIESTSCDDKDKTAANKLTSVLSTLETHSSCPALKCRTVHWLGCDGNNIIIDVEFLMDLDEEVEYSDIQSWVYNKLQDQIRSAFSGQSVTMGSNTLINCPEGTLLQKDLSCRGCSKGYFLDGFDMLCKPCPSGYYQDENLKMNCKPCPPGAPKDKIGLQGISDCFHVESFTQSTSLVKVVAVVFSIAFVASVLLFFRSQVAVEPDGKTREFYPEPIRQKMEQFLGKETAMPEVGTDFFKTSVVTSGEGDHLSVKDSDDDSDNVRRVVQSVSRRIDMKPRKLTNARMSIAGLAAARLAGAFDPVPRKGKKITMPDMQSTMAALEWHPIKQRTSVFWPKNHPKCRLTQEADASHDSTGKSSDSMDLYQAKRLSSMVDSEAVDNLNKIFSRKHSLFKLTGPKD